jgi:hypothetical protein
MRTQVTLAVLAAALLSLISQKANAQYTLSGNYLRVGVGADGSIINPDDNTQTYEGQYYSQFPGIIYDAGGTGNFSVNNDFITPGSPYQSYAVGYGGGYGLASFEYGTSLTISSTTNTSAGGTLSTVTKGAYGALAYTQTLSFGVNSTIINFTTTLSNTSDSTMSNVVFATSFDPDPDVYQYGSYYTVNQVVTPSVVQAEGPETTNSIIIQTVTSGGEVEVDPSWDPNPYAISAGSDGVNSSDVGAYQNGDFSIGGGYNFGDLGAGDSITFNYNYIINGTPVNPTSPILTGGVPDAASTLALLGLGLAGLIAARRKLALV